MKNLSLTTFSILFAFAAHAQLSIGLSGGASLPTGDYKGKYGEESGYAITGSTVNIEISYDFNHLVGASLLWGGALHGVDEIALANEAGVSSSQFSTGDWVHNYFLVGPTLGKSTEDYEVKVHFRFGSIVSSGPYVKAGYKFVDGGESNPAFALGFGAEGAFYFNRRIGFFAGIDVIGGEPYFPTETTTVTGYQVISMLNLKVGLKYRFWKG